MNVTPLQILKRQSPGHNAGVEVTTTARLPAGTGMHAHHEPPSP